MLPRRHLLTLLAFLFTVTFAGFQPARAYEDDDDGYSQDDDDVEVRPLFAIHRGTFFMSFGTGPNGTNEIDFGGNGFTNVLGFSAIDGHSTLQFISPECMEIVDDGITLFELWDDDNTLFMEASGIDCLDMSNPNRPRIRGQGALAIDGGSGDFEHTTGSGAWFVFADILEQTPSTASGEFTIFFIGKLASPSF